MVSLRQQLVLTIAVTTAVALQVRLMQPLQPAVGLGFLLLATGLAIAYFLPQHLRDRLQPHEVQPASRAKPMPQELTFSTTELTYRDIYNNAIEGIYQTTLTGQYIRANPALAQLYGYESPDDLISHLTDIGQQLYVDAGRRLEFQQALAQTGSITDFEAEIYVRNGNTLWISETARLVRDADGHPLYYEGFVSNISRRKQAEAELHQRNHELAQALRNLKQAQEELILSEKMVALGQLIAGVAHEINTPLGAIRSSASTMAKYLTQTLTKLPPLLQRLSPEETDQFIALIQRSLHKAPLLSAKEERQLRRKLTQTLHDQGFNDSETLAETLVIMGIHSDLSTVSYLLHHPDYQAILELAYQLSGLHRSTQTINTATERASKVVFALKNYAHQTPDGEPVPAIVTDSLDMVLTLYHNQLKRGVEVVRRYEAVPPIWCYPDKLSQVWTNIIHNAIQAMQHNGTLTIEVTPTAHQIQVRITDTGSGIPAAIQAKIFEPFFTTKPAGEGSGLGLNVVKSIVEQHQGHITVQSQPGQTTFQVDFPLTLTTQFPRDSSWQNP